MDCWGDVFPRLFPGILKPELEALLEGCEIRLAGAHFRRLVIESSWSPKESTGPVDFFQRFSSSWCASASSFHLASSPQNNPAACLAECFFPESGVVFTTLEGGWLGFVGVLDEPGMFWQVGMAVTHSTKDAGQLAKKLGGPRRDSPSNNPLWEPHRLGMIWFRKKYLVHSHVVHLLPEGTGHLQDGVKESPEPAPGAHVPWPGPPAGYGCFTGPHRCAAWPLLRPQLEVGLPRERLE